MKYQLLIALFFFNFISASDNFLVMSGRKTSQYIDSGFIKNNPQKTVKSSLSAIRTFYKKDKDEERVVFDFETQKLPRLMVYLSASNKNLVITMNLTQKNKELVTPKKTLMFSAYSLYQLEQSSLVAQMDYRRPKEIDVFFLENPARLVIDVRVKKVLKRKQ